MPTAKLLNKLPLPLNRKTALIVLIIGLALLVYLKKGWFIAATVNNLPIANFELLSKMNQQYREATLSQMINEKILLNEARKKGVMVTKTEVDNKISELEGNLGGAEVLNSMLTQQGQTRNSLRDQISIQLTIEKLFADEATVSAEEIDKYLLDNQDQLQATDSAAQRKEAEDNLKQQKLTEAFNTKFAEWKQAANIKIF